MVWQDYIESLSITYKNVCFLCDVFNKITENIAKYKVLFSYMYNMHVHVHNACTVHVTMHVHVHVHSTCHNACTCTIVYRIIMIAKWTKLSKGL